MHVGEVPLDLLDEIVFVLAAEQLTTGTLKGQHDVVLLI